MKVFIGCSSQYLNYAREISYLLEEFNCISVPWWQPKVFPLNETIINSLIKNFNDCDAGLFIFSEDDKIFEGNLDFMSEMTKLDVRTKSRDNVIFEFGLFAGINGMEKTVIARLGKPKMPSDLGGILYIGLEFTINMDASDFKNKNEKYIKRWIEEQNKRQQQNIKYDNIINNLKKQAEKCSPNYKDKILEIIKKIESKEDGLDYNENNVMVGIKRFLRSTKSIIGVDAAGPIGWLKPSAYRYLAPQLKEYLRRNINDKNRFILKIDELVYKAVENAFLNAKLYFPESYTDFDNDLESFFSSRVQIDELNLQYCRFLLWTNEELLRPETEAIIIIHEAFYVPLFFIETDKNSNDRKYDFLVLESKTGDINDDTFFNSKRQTGYKEAYIVDNKKECEELKKIVINLLSNDKIMFAIDARKKLQQQKEHEQNA